ncbi:hypothetical protein ABTE18_21055, partial [Acinetobacter baumannii]
LLMMGDIKAHKGDDRAATAHYQTALALAERQESTPAALQPMLDRAIDLVAQAQSRFADHLARSLSDVGLADGRGGARLRQSIDL